MSAAIEITVLQTVALPVNTVAPAVTGTATVGQTLSTTNGTWSNSPTGYTYQWQRDNTGGGTYSNIGSATASTYTLVDADDACKIRCVVTATNAGGSTPANSNATAAVIEPAPTNSVAPVASGTAVVGSSLSVTNGTWAHMGGNSPTFTYQWQRDVAGNSVYSNISSATASSYTLVDADDACHVRCVVTAHNTNASTASANSNAIGPDTEPAPTNSVAPVASGTATVGSVLSSTSGTWTHMAGSVATFAYQWQRDNTGGLSYSNIGGATANTYTLVDADDACHVRCVVTATNTNASPGTANTNAIGVIAEPVPTNSVAPTVSGTAQVGRTLTCATGTWANMGGHAPTFTYQWRVSVDGSTFWTNISAATSATFTPGIAYVGKFLDCVVTAHNTGSP